MAIQYINASFISRSYGHNALKAAAYRANAKLYCERTGETFDYTNKKDCVYESILLPKDAFNESLDKENHPFLDREKFWNAIEVIEASHNRHASAQLAMELKVALPKELNLDQQIEIINTFIKENYIKPFGVAADVCIHDKGDNNPHAHVMLSLRKIKGVQFARVKERKMAAAIKYGSHGNFSIPDQLNQQWQIFQNEYFVQKEIDLQVDQGYIIPTIHQGRTRNSDRYYQRSADNEVIKLENAELVKENYDIILDTLEQRHAVFTKRDIKSLIFKTTAALDDPNAYEDILKAVMASDRLVPLGYAESGGLSFTTQETYHKEVELSQRADLLTNRSSHTVKKRAVKSVIAKQKLRPEQAETLKYITQSGDISCIAGWAGTGKTYTMRAVKSLYESNGYAVYGCALAGKAAQGLADEAGIESSTIYSLIENYHQGRVDKKYFPAPGSVLIVDEAGMIGLGDMSHLLMIAEERQLKLVLIGDQEQLQPVAKGAPFRAILERVGFYQMQDVRRQKNKLARQATCHLALGKVGLAIDYYVEQGCVTLDDEAIIEEALLAQWKASNRVKDRRTLIIAFRKAQVDRFNALVRSYLLEIGVLKNEQEFSIQIGRDTIKRKFACGDRIVLLENKKLNDIAVKNGQLGYIRNISEKMITVALDNGQTVSFDSRDYRSFDHGYATTVHKAQGVSVDHCLVYASEPGWDRHLSYVGLSRHRDKLYLYANKATYSDIDGLKRALSKQPLRDNVLDYPLQFATRRGYDAHTFATNAVNKIRGLSQKTRDQWNYLFNYESYKTDQKNIKINQKRIKQQVLNKQARLVADLADLHLDCILQYGAFIEEYGKSWYDNQAAKAAFAPIDRAFSARNKQAFQVAKQGQQFERALALNNIALEQLQDWSDAHVTESRVQAFHNVINPYEKGRLAQAIVDEQKKSAPYVSRLDLWQDLNTAHQSNVLLIKGLQIEGFSERLKAIERFLFMSRSASRYWHKSQAEHFNEQAGEELAHQRKYADISATFQRRAEVLATKITTDFERYNQVLTVKFPYEKTYGKIVDWIKQKAECFERRVVIRTYISTDTDQLSREQAAYKLDQDRKAYFGISREEGLVWAGVAQTAQPEKIRVFRASLSPEYYGLFDEIEQYKATSKACAQSFVQAQRIERGLKARLKSKDEQSKDEANKKLKQAHKKMYKLMAQRHQMAYDIVQPRPVLEDWGKNSPERFDEIHYHLDAKKFMRHVALHEERLAAKERVEQFVKLPSDSIERMPLAAEMIKRMGKHRFHLKKHQIQEDLIWQLAMCYQYQMENEQFSGDDKISHQRLSEYMLAYNAVVQAERAVSQASPQGEATETLIKIAQARASNCNKAAFKVSQLSTQYINDAVYEKFTSNTKDWRGFDWAQLNQQVKTHLSTAIIAQRKAAVPISAHPLIKSDQEMRYGIKSAQSIARACVSIENTLAQDYMARHCNIYDVTNTTLRFLPEGARWTDYIKKDGQFIEEEKTTKAPAIIITATDQVGQVCRVQCAYLDDKTAAKHDHLDNAELSKGDMKNGALLQKGTNGSVYITESVEVGASVALADNQSTVLVNPASSDLQNILETAQNHQPKDIILLKDYDPARADHEYKEEAQHFIGVMLDVVVKVPERSQRILETKGKQAPTGWNDIIQDKGVNGLRDALGLTKPKQYERQFIRRLDEWQKHQHKIPEHVRDYPHVKLLFAYMEAEYNTCRHLFSITKKANNDEEFKQLINNPYTKRLQQDTARKAFDLVAHEKGLKVADILGVGARVVALAKAALSKFPELGIHDMNIKIEKQIDQYLKQKSVNKQAQGKVF